MTHSEKQTIRISVIVPLLNESARLPSLLSELALLDAQQIIIVDGGSNDGSWQSLQQQLKSPELAHIHSMQSPRGRAVQMNAGAEIATGDVLLFLHADTQLPKGALSEVRRVVRLPDVQCWGRFDVTFDSQLRGIKMVAYFINLRSRVSGIATGDQAMFFSRRLFDRVGGFEVIELMEDVAISKKCRRFVSGYCSRLKVTTSARRWEQNGVWNTIFKMWWTRLAFLFGVSPAKLLRGYRNVR